MSYEIKFPELPAGYSLDAARAGEVATCVRHEFTSSEEGDLFISRLEGIPRFVISKLPEFARVRESMIDHLLVVIRKDKSAVVYVNELNMRTCARAKGDLSKGDPVSLDQILDIQSLAIEGVTIPEDAGFLFIMSAGWRKGLYFDLRPLFDSFVRDFDVESAFGHYYAYLRFQHLFSIPEAVWSEIMRQEWFPFIHLEQGTVLRMIGFAKSGFQINELLDGIANEVLESVANQIAAWDKHSVLSCHFAIIMAAFKEFQEADYISACAILYPRIEGIMRSHHFARRNALHPSQGNLVASVTDGGNLPSHECSLLLPKRFRRFLTEVYFASFQPRNPVGLSRHTVAHGVAPDTSFDKKGAVLGFLILLQIVALLP